MTWNEPVAWLFFSTKETSVLELKQNGAKDFLNSNLKFHATWMSNGSFETVYWFINILYDLRKFEDSNGHSKAVEGLGII